MWSKNQIFSTLAGFLLLCASCKPKEQASKSNAVKAGPNVTYSAPGKLQFEAKSNLYEALAEFRDWKFTEIKFANKENLNGLLAKLEINMNSVFEKTIRLTQDLKNPDYFDVKKYPKAYIKIYEVKATNDSIYAAKMDIKLKDKKMTKPFEFTVIQTSPNYKVKGQVTLLRETFEVGMTMSSIESEVKVMFETELKLPEIIKPN
jgi:polyisoprenoid-binding protein YceI